MIELVIRVIILFNYMFTNYYDDIYQFKLENIDDLSELFEILNKARSAGPFLPRWRARLP